ncbi:MAG: CHAT domain-containing protein, partial [Deltaproteobacteria bacterium]|nr:CHAT domain-containing protein [Deltaproteobacteria bacterium]
AYQLLLADAEGELEQAQELVIRAEGLMRFIPFHALLRGRHPDQSSPGRSKASFVISRWVVSYLPISTPATPLTCPHTATVLLPNYGRKAQPILSGPSEAQLVRLQGRAAQILRGRAATPGAMLSALSTPRSLVHFAGHALANLEHGGAPELLFGPEESFGAATLRGVRVRSSLVVLASCTTAYTARFRGERVRLARHPLHESLLRVGAGAVIAASWGVKDAQSQAQMKTFYRHLEQRGPAEALALAQRERIARLRPPHPRFWAFYALYGAAHF